MFCTRKILWCKIFSKVPKGYIEFRYLGGQDYEKKYSTILSMTEHFITSLYETLVHTEYTEKDLKLLDSILEKHRACI